MNNIFLGIVMCGGKSSRMGSDKVVISYHGIQQWKYLYNQLVFICDEVIISCRQEQAALFNDDINIVIDKWNDIGPLAGILSVMEQYPTSTIMVVGCDYPLVHIEDLKLLKEQAKQSFEVTTFMDKSSMTIEPLIAVYQPIMLSHLKKGLANKNYSLQKIIKVANANFIMHEGNERLKSFDTMDIASAYFQSI